MLQIPLFHAIDFEKDVIRSRLTELSSASQNETLLVSPCLISNIDEEFDDIKEEIIQEIEMDKMGLCEFVYEQEIRILLDLERERIWMWFVTQGLKLKSIARKILGFGQKAGFNLGRESGKIKMN